MMVWVTNDFREDDDLPNLYFQRIAKKGLVIGSPKATPKYSVKELVEMDMVGLYREELP